MLLVLTEVDNYKGGGKLVSRVIKGIVLDYLDLRSYGFFFFSKEEHAIDS